MGIMLWVNLAISLTILDTLRPSHNTVNHYLCTNSSQKITRVKQFSAFHN